MSSRFIMDSSIKNISLKDIADQVERQMEYAHSDKDKERKKVVVTSDNHHNKPMLKIKQRPVVGGSVVLSPQKKS